MEVPRLLFVGHTSTQHSPLITALEKRYCIIVARNGKQALEYAAKEPFEGVILDAISMRTPGDRICKQLREGLPNIPLVHLHPRAKGEIQSAADIVLLQPIKPRTLLEALDRLLQKQDDDHWITCGPFSVNRARGILIAHGQETRLTPKQALLVETFLLHPGRILDRRTLMEKVWQTDYLGDTRTLDVHIRWVRQALEIDASTPRYLITVRGVGYSLEVPEEEFALAEP